MENIWWTQVSNARAFVSQIIDFAADGKSVLVEVPEHLPWYDKMVELIERGLKEKLDYNLEFLEDDDRDPGEIIMRKFCKPEKIETYRPAIGYAKFLAESSDIILNTRFVWITDISPERYEAWSDFVYQYKRMAPQGRPSGIFILEMKDASGAAAKKGIQQESYDKTIGRYDCFVFYALAAALNNEHPILKQYLAELVTAIAGSDIELGAECLRPDNTDILLRDPWQTLKEIAETRVRSNGQDFEIPKDEDEIQQCIWNAQIKTIFPIIENFRRSFLEDHHESIQNELPITNSIGEDVTDAKEIEIGSLLYLVCEKGIQLLPEEHDKLHAFKDARNDLAHLKTLSKEQLQSIVKLA